MFTSHEKRFSHETPTFLMMDLLNALTMLDFNNRVFASKGLKF